MGHTRLGVLPKTQSWSAVVASLAGRQRRSEGGSGGAGVLDQREIARLADKTLDAARGGLERAKDDPGLQYTVFLLSQVALASRQEDWEKRLADLGLRLSDDATLFDLTVEFQAAVDDWLGERNYRSDFSEMAQRAAGEALVALTSPRAHTLFGDSGENLRLAVRAFSTRKGFSDLGEAFFGRFMAGFLNFYLSRVAADRLGHGPLHQVGDLTAFNKLLLAHCEQSAHIVRDFSGQWYSKTEFESGISLDNTGGFVAVALAKLQDELRQQQRGQEPSTSTDVPGSGGTE